MSYEVRVPTLDELRMFYEFRLIPDMEEVRGLFVRGRMIGISGILPDPHCTGSLLEDEARTIGFFDVIPGQEDLIGLDMVRRIRGWLKENNRTVWVQHDDKHPKAEKLLRVLGFEPTDEVRGDLQNSGRQLRMWRRAARGEV